MIPEDEDYKVVRSTELPPQPARRAYWQIVRDSVEQIYHQDPNLADRQAEIIGESSKGTQEKIYQTEPLTIAADLAGHGNRVPTPEELHEYLRIKARRLGRPAEELPDLDELKTTFAHRDSA